MKEFLSNYAYEWKDKKCYSWTNISRMWHNVAHFQLSREKIRYD